MRHELIYHDAGATTPEVLSVDEIRRLIAEAGREPVERDTLYHRVVRDGAALANRRAAARPIDSRRRRHHESPQVNSRSSTAGRWRSIIALKSPRLYQ